MNSQSTHDPEDHDYPAPESPHLGLPHLARWTRWPILMYLTIVTVFAILAVFVVHYVLTHVPRGS
jgi:hypothetical protein